MEKTKRTYISLFSCAGVGCYGFKMNDFECIATNELLEPRIAVQKVNHKCKYDSGYICGDATAPETHQKIFDEIEMWKEKEGLKQVDVVFATPPCQGMSTANYKKNDHEQIRNSLVVEAIKMIKAINPKVFVFENVRAFMKSICTDISGDDMVIEDCIYKNLSNDYNIHWKVINFKDYGVPSSRPRTLVIGTNKALSSVTPLQLFPTRQEEILLKDSIGSFPRLDYCQKDPKDPFHFARPFPEYMLAWIKDLKEGETAFDNPDETKPCTFDKDGNRVINKGAYMGNKYRRLIWNRPGACIATRSDVMSSQDTIHPCDNRVLSIRELMTLMTIPNTFKWTDHDDTLTVENSDEYLKENEGNIRRCIGEAVPTQIGFDISGKIRSLLDFQDYVDNTLSTDKIDYYILCYKNFSVSDYKSSYDSLKKLDADIDNIKVLVKSEKDFITYIPQLCSYYSQADTIKIDVSEECANIGLLQDALKYISLGSNVEINFDYRPHGFVYHNIVIDKAGCRYVQEKATAKKRQEDPLQLSLF